MGGLRIVRAPAPPAVNAPTAAAPPDGWAARLAKLVPAEALGLYTAGANIIPKTNTLSLETWAGVCLLICVWV